MYFVFFCVVFSLKSATLVSYEVVAYVKDAQPRPSLSLLAAVMQTMVQRGRVSVFTMDTSSHQADGKCF